VDARIVLGRKHVPWMIWWAIAVHVEWGCALILDPGIVPIIILVGLHWIIALGVSGAILGVVLVAAALVAAAGMLIDTRVSNRIGLLLLLPQYALLVAAFVSDSQSIITGMVDGRAIDRLLLFTALWPVMIAALLHSAAIVERHLAWTPRR
jgi:hypothetical protein